MRKLIFLPAILALLMRQQPKEPDREFVTPFDQTDFLWTRELFIAR